MLLDYWKRKPKFVINPLSPSIHMQILHTDPRIFA